MGIFFSFRLLSAKKWQYIISFFGIFLGLTFLFFFLSLSAGIQQSVESQLFQHQEIITLQPLPKKISFLEKKLDTAQKEKILQYEGVEAVYSEVSLLIPSFAQSSAMLGFPVDIAFVRGLDSEMFWQEAQIPIDTNNIPVLIAPFALDFLNSFAAQIPGFSGFSPQKLLGQRIDITFGKSAFIPLPESKTQKKYQAQIIAVTDIAPVVGLTFEMQSLKKIAEELGENFPTTANRFHIKVSHPKYIKSLIKQLEAEDFFVRSQQESAEKISSGLLIGKIFLLVFASIIVILSFLFLFSTLSISVLEHMKTIGILRSLGASKWAVQKIFFIQGLIITMSATIIALIVNFFLMDFVQQKISIVAQQYSFFPKEIFYLSWETICVVVLGVILATILAIFFPVWRVIKKDPILALI